MKRTLTIIPLLVLVAAVASGVIEKTVKVPKEKYVVYDNIPPEGAVLTLNIEPDTDRADKIEDSGILFEDNSDDVMWRKDNASNGGKHIYKTLSKTAPENTAAVKPPKEWVTIEGHYSRQAKGGWFKKNEEKILPTLFTVTVPSLDLDGDCDRDGTIDDTDEELEENQGTFVKINNDDDNNDSVDDNAGSNAVGPVAGENNLEQLRISLLPDTLAEGTVSLKRSGTNVRIWSSNVKGAGKEVLFANNEKTWDLTSSLERTDFNNVKSNLWMEGMSAGTVNITLTYKHEKDSQTTSDTLKVVVGQGKVFFVCGFWDNNEEEQNTTEAYMFTKLAGLESALLAKKYQVVKIQKSSKNQLLAALEDPETVGLFWFSHGGIECKPSNADCERMESRVWEWNGGQGDRIWVSEWEQVLKSKRLKAIWLLSCASADPGTDYHSTCYDCNNCNITTGRPEVLKTFATSRDQLIWGGAGNTLITYPSAVPTDVENTIAQSAFNTALK